MDTQIHPAYWKQRGYHFELDCYAASSYTKHRVEGDADLGL
jgi:hypothetical protein